jgi:hypothetical protein
MKCNSNASMTEPPMCSVRYLATAVLEVVTRIVTQ